MRKGQAALEFIMTYGWAFLVLLSAISALAYFGVFSDKTQTERCLFTSGVTCKEFTLTNIGVKTNLTLIFQNNLGEPITINALNVSGEKQIGNCNPQTADLTADGTQRFECEFTTFTKKSMKFDSTVIYKKVLGDYNHTATGDIIVNN